MATGPTLTRDRVISELEGMVCDALSRLADESGTSANVTMVDRTREAEVQDEDDGAISLDCGRSVTRRAESGFVARKQLAQTWVVVAQLHDALVSGKKMTQRELWYRLKTTELFSGPPQVNERILDVCAAVSFRCGVPCPRESVGIVAAPRGTMSGCVVVLGGAGGEAQPLDKGAVFEVPGDTEIVRGLRFSPSATRARCVLVVEKDSVFRRLLNDRFFERLPCVLITACGFPDLATRAVVRRVVDDLGVRAFALTDYNPHGIALMLTYKVGSSNFGLESGLCTPSLRWLGLRAADVRRADDDDDDDDDIEPPLHRQRHGRMRMPFLPADAYQPFTQRDRAVLDGLSRRAIVAESADLSDEVRRMGEAEVKVEIEALHTFGFDFIAEYLQDRILSAPPDADGGAASFGGGSSDRGSTPDAPTPPYPYDGGTGYSQSQEWQEESLAPHTQYQARSQTQSRCFSDGNETVESYDGPAPSRFVARGKPRPCLIDDDW